MKKIFYISNAYPSYTDNYAVFCKVTYEIINNSSSLKINLSELIKGKSYKRYYNIFRYIKLVVMTYIKSLFLLKKYDLVYIQYVWVHAFFISFLFPFYKIMGKKIIINFHGEDLINYKELNILFKHIFNKICLRSNVIIIPSQYFKKILLQINNQIDKKIYLFPSGGINTNIFNKNKYKMPRNNTPKIVYCSRFDKEKGWDDFINGIYLLINKMNIKCNAYMLGYGNEICKARQLIDDKNLESIIYLLEDASQYKMQEIYSTSDIFVFPTRRQAESLGLVALEAMSCGLPVIGTNLGALPEYLTDGYNGFMFEAGNANSLAMMLQKYIQLDDKEKQKLSDNAYNTSKKYFDNIVKKGLIQKLTEL